MFNINIKYKDDTLDKYFHSFRFSHLIVGNLMNSVFWLLYYCYKQSGQDIFKGLHRYPLDKELEVVTLDHVAFSFSFFQGQ